MNTFAIPALKEKRAHIAGRVISLKKQIIKHKRELASLDATITLFDPSYKVGSIKAIKPNRRSKLFKMGELGRLIIDALRRANGVSQSTSEVTSAVSAAIGQGKTSEAVLFATVRSNLAYLVRRGSVVKSGDRAALKWSLPV